jgi:uncharacterized protein (TIGR00269 family)
MKCACGRKAVFFRRYEGRYLCGLCFCRSIEKKFKKTVGKYEMIKPGDKIMIALSGGKDSTTALYLMNGIIGKRKDIKLFAFTVDEGLKGFRKECIRVAARFCKKLGIRHHTTSYKKYFGKSLEQIMNKREDDPCSYCGIARRQVLNKEARRLKASKVCMGLNLDDEAESALMNYLRGDLHKASRMGPVTEYSAGKEGGRLFIPRIKPLREIPEEEVRLYANLKGLGYCKGRCPFRGGFRFEIKAFLKSLEKKHPGIKFSILETFDSLLPFIRQAVTYKEPKILKCRMCGEPSSQKVCQTCMIWR